MPEPFFSSRIVLPTKRPFRWKLFLIVWAGAVVGLIAVIPYSLSLQSAALKTISLRMPLALLLALQVLQNAVLSGVLAGIGLFLACRIGLGLPFLEGWLNRKPLRGRFRPVLLASIVLGLASGLIIAALDRWAFGPSMKSMLQNLDIALPQSTAPSAWKGLLASIEGGITEEVLLRLFALTLLAWLGSLVSRDAEGRPTPAVLWLANVLAAVLFGLGHLPATAASGLPLNGLVITRAVVLNGSAGLAFGWLYWTFGLESAMISHFSADIVLHGILAGL